MEATRNTRTYKKINTDNLVKEYYRKKVFLGETRRQTNTLQTKHPNPNIAAVIHTEVVHEAPDAVLESSLAVPGGEDGDVRRPRAAGRKRRQC